MKKELTYQEALHKACSFCSLAERCESEVREKLSVWGISIDESDEIIEKLKAENFLNEQRFVAAFVKDKFRFNKWGKIKIAYALQQKKIETSLVQTVLSEKIDEEEYEQVLMELLQSKMKGLKYKDKYDLQAKLYRFAQSRGFEGSVVSKVFSRVSKS